MATVTHDDLSICTICLHLIANGEYNDGTDIAELTSDRMVAKWGDLTMCLTLGGEELGFSTRECDGCGNTDHGDRFTACIIQ